MGSMIEMIGNIVSEEDDPGQPAPRDVGRETRDTLQARIDLAPQLRQVDYEDARAGSQRNLASLKDFLFGYNDPGRTVKTQGPQRQVWIHGQTGQRMPDGFMPSTSPQFQPNAAGQLINLGRAALNPANAPAQYFQQWVPGDVTETTEPGAFTPGFLDTYEKELQPRLSAIAERERKEKLAQDMALATEFGPQYLAAMRASNPEQFALRDRLVADAGSELALGDQLDPFEQRTLQQQVRAAQSARGVGTGSSDAAAEAYYTTAGAQNRRAQRRDFARSMIGLDQALIGNPFTSITGRDTGNAPGAILGTAQQNSLAGRRDPFDPFNGYANDVFGSNFNAGWANYADVRNRNRSLNDAMWSNAGKTLNSVLSMAGGGGGFGMG